MPFINSFIHDSVVTPPTYAVLIGGMDISLSMTASLSAVAGTIQRSSSGFQQVTSTYASASSKTLTFTTMPTDTVYSGRIVVFQICVSFDAAGSGTVSSVSYGGTSLTRAIGTHSTGDKGSAEIWYGVFATQPANNNLIVSGTSMSRVMAGREILTGATQVAPDRINVNKAASTTSVAIELDHVANSIAFVNGLIWKGGLDELSMFNLTGDSPQATKTWSTLNTDGNNFATVGGYCEMSSIDNNKEYRCAAFGLPSGHNPTLEIAGAVWK